MIRALIWGLLSLVFGGNALSIFILAAGYFLYNGNLGGNEFLLGVAVVTTTLSIVTGIAARRAWRRRKAAAKAKIEDDARGAQIMSQITDGTLPTMLATKVLTRPGEVTHFASSATLLKHQSTGMKMGGGGISFYVAKGVRINTGGGRSKPVKDWIPVASGELALTSQRAVFVGDFKSFESPWAKLTHVEAMGDALVFHVGTSAHIVGLPLAADEIQIAAAIVQHLRKNAT